MGLAESMKEMDEFKVAIQNQWTLENIKPNNQHYCHSPRKVVYIQNVQLPPYSCNRRPITLPSRNNNSNNDNDKMYVSSTWSLNDPEAKRQRRVVKYKSYAVESRMKTTFRNGFRWMKNKYCALVHGY